MTEFADKVAQIGEKGGGVEFGTETFGLVGQMFATEARQTSQQAAEEIKTFSERTKTLGDEVSACGQDYASTDDQNAQCLGQIQW
ncbi:hypothetical protein [Allosaccharopolyspora coralli]|uniref:hypothetical protein n=1 Tax=Allosaccharopolyspora coralli TaxID=2665642 RepID=UPI001652A905